MSDISKMNGHPVVKQRETKMQSAKNRNSATSDWRGYLEALGIYGFQEIELPVLCALITGDPILLVGAHGTAKTALASVLADALGLSFHAYDASKAMFEDMVGFPNPDSLSQGELDYVPTEISLWDKEFILADEISRASAQTQSKWLEIIRSRKIMGQPLDQLKYIFAAMNPPGTYDGANPLDPALAGRFAWVLKVPESAEMSHEERMKVTESVGSDDAPVAEDIFDETIHSQDGGGVLNRLDSFQERLQTTRNNWSSRISDYISRLSESVFASSQKESKNLDGRRIGILRRNLLTAQAVTGAESPGRSKLYEKVLMQSLPHSALGEKIPDHLYKMAHREAYQAVFKENTTDRQYQQSDELLDRVLDEESFEEIVTPLTLLGNEIYRMNSGSESDPRNLEVFRRVVHTGSKALKKEPDVVKSMCDYQRAIWNEPEGTVDLAQILVAWWSAEKDKNLRNAKKEFLQAVKGVNKKLENLLGSED